MKNVFIVLKKSRILVILVCFIVILSHFVVLNVVPSYKKIVNQVNNKIFNSFNKEDELNNNNIFFVANLNEKILGKEEPNLKLPSLEEYEILDGVFNFNIKENFVIYSAGYGIVKSVGYLDNGLKYVEIKHSGNITTRYENLKVVGVGANFLVKNIHIIGTTTENFTFKILKDNIVLTNFTINDGEIIWQE